MGVKLVAFAIACAVGVFAGWTAHAATVPELPYCPAEDSCQVDWDGTRWLIRTGGPDQGHVGDWQPISTPERAGE